MKKRISILWFILFPAFCFSQNVLVIKNVSVIDIKDPIPKKNQIVVIEGNKITSIGSSVKIPVSAKIIDGKNKFVIPGLWDMHAHAISENRYEYTFPLLIANGVTGVREMGTFLPIDQVNKLRQDVSNGKLLGPRLGALTYRIIDGAGTDTSTRMQINTPDEARAIVRSYKQQGADFIKPYNLLSREVYLAIVDEAKKQKIPVEGHVPFSMTPEEVSDLGQKTIEHNFGILLFCSANSVELRKQLLSKTIPWGRLDAQAAKSYDKRKADSLYRRFVHNGTWSCPTVFDLWPLKFRSDSTLMSDSLMKYVPKNIRQGWHETFLARIKNVPDDRDREIRWNMIMASTADMYHAGVQLLAGTDMPEPYTIPGFSLHQELELLVQAGLSPIDALRTATINPAKFLGKENELGTVEKGRIADLVLLDANPLENISNTRKIFAVITNGRLLERKDLDELLNKVKGSAAK
jgi:imidazolonepropionase-like amidohydrolase